MSDTFTPLVIAPVSNAESPMVPLKVLSQAEVKAAFEPLTGRKTSEQQAKACAPPSVTLQRQGETVSGIRIECGCGQVIELACAY